MNILQNTLERLEKEKFKELTNDKNDKFIKSDTLRVQQLAARDRARKLSLETNRRRRALELKKRLEAQKETKRREEVLEDRRKRQQEATHKFQRLKKGSPRVPSDRTAGKSYYSAPLQDGIQIAHGSRVDSASDSRLHETPDLEDALRLVSGHTSHGSYGSHTAPTGYVNSALHQHEYGHTDNSLHRKYGMDSNGNTTAPSSYHGYSTQATATNYTSGHGRVPVKQFQQDLQEQQRKFLVEQAKSLQEFNEEIMKETTPTNVLERSDSLSSLDSLDSLEEQPQRSSKKNHKDKENTRYSVSKPSGPAVTANYYTQGYYSTPPSTKNNQNQAPTFHISELDSPQARLFVSNQRTLDTGDGVIRDSQKQKTNGEMKLEETSESDFVSELVEDRNPMLLEKSNQHQRSSLPRSYADAVGSNYNTRTSEAWVPQTSHETSYVNSGQSAFSGISGHSVLSGGARKAGSSSPNVARTRHQFSAKTSATTFTVVPNTNGSNISHQATHQQVMSSPKYTQQITSSPKYTQQIASSPKTTQIARSPKYTQQIASSPKTTQIASSPYRTKERSESSEGKERQRGVQFEETSAAVKPEVNKPTKGNSKNRAKEPVSILKKTISYDQPAKLGGFKVRDSLEISKSSPGKKKSIRWADHDEYDDDEVVPAEEDSVSKEENGYEDVPSEDSKDISMQQQNRPMSGVNGRDDKPSHQNGVQKDTSSKSRPQSMYNNSSYGSSYASKKQTERPSSVVTPASTAMSRPVSARTVQKKLSSGGKSGNVSTGQNGVVRAANGVRLDKTPTDAEINWLWDKVRTCLNSKDEESDHAKVTERPPSGQQPQPRQVASMTSQYIDGGRITANLRIPQASAVAQSRNNGVPRWRTNSDSGSYLRRTALLHQRRQHSAISRGQGSAHQQPVPASSHQGPTRTATMPPPNLDNEVSDSLLAFQRAEQLINDNVNEADLGVAVDNHRLPSNQDKVPTTALSMEEQRILESLDRLNERLRSVAPEITPYVAITPKPPPYGGSFRGKRPLSSKQLAIAAEQVPSSRIRASSADRSNVRMNCYQ